MMKCLSVIGALAVSVAAMPTARAQFTADYQTNTISGVTSNWSGDYYVGNANFADVLLIQNGGVLVTGSIIGGTGGYVGYNASSSNNSVLVSGTGSVWTNLGGPMYFGYSGAGNSLVVSNGGGVFFFVVGNNAGSSNNSVLVTGSGSFLEYAAAVGWSGAGNSLVVSDGGRVFELVWIGRDLSSSNNSVLVSGTGSVWSNNNSHTLAVGYSGAGNSLVISNGGQVILPRDAYIGQMFGGCNNRVRVVDGGFWQNTALHVGEQGSGNSLVVAGGSVRATNLIVGFASLTCDNLVQLDSGSVIVTNATADAVFEVRNGKLILNGGVLQVDRFVMTNACAQFVRSGGTLMYGTAVLDPTRDDDGDGIPNGWEQAHGLDPLNFADANLDSDGDGFTNLQEFQAGTDPTNSASSFRITSLVSTDHDVLVTWTMGTAKTNALQAAAGDGGFYTNAFADIFTVTNTVGTVTNYLDAGGATNVPARYYRVRLVP